MMNAQAQLQRLASSSPFHALLPNSSIRSRRQPAAAAVCRRRPIPALQKLTTMPHTAAAPTASAVAAIGTAMEKATDRFHVMDFHHVEFWCADAASAAARFSFGLGVPLAEQSDLSTGNTAHASRLLRSRWGSLSLLFTAPYMAADDSATSTATVRSFSADTARRFTGTHGLAVRAVAVRVANAAEAFRASVHAGARPAFARADLGHGFGFAEVELSGDTILRFVGYPDDTDISFLPGFQDVVSSGGVPDFGLTRLDHVDVNIPELAPVAASIAGFTGFHKFHEYTADEKCTAESGVNFAVLANNSATVLISLVEPVYGTRLRSHVETFLDHHGGPGIQHLALMSDDILGTLRDIRARSSMGGFELLPPPPASYYEDARQRVGDVLSEEQMKECQELGVRVARGHDNGVVLQTFTKPVGDRPTLLLEFVQRIGCLDKEEGEQRHGCGGFARKNVSDLVKSIDENNNNTLNAPTFSAVA